MGGKFTTLPCSSLAKPLSIPQDIQYLDHEKVWGLNAQQKYSHPMHLTFNSITPHYLHITLESALS
jgi:hypothetical protein